MQKKSTARDDPPNKAPGALRTYAIGFLLGGLTQALVVPLAASALARGLAVDNWYAQVSRITLQWILPPLFAFLVAWLLGGRTTRAAPITGIAVGMGSAVVWLAVLMAGVGVPLHLVALAAACIAGGAAGAALGSRHRRVQ